MKHQCAVWRILTNTKYDFKFLLYIRIAGNLLVWVTMIDPIINCMANWSTMKSGAF